jgi:hypothetical protein
MLAKIYLSQILEAPLNKYVNKRPKQREDNKKIADANRQDSKFQTQVMGTIG